MTNASAQISENQAIIDALRSLLPTQHLTVPKGSGGNLSPLLASVSSGVSVKNITPLLDEYKLAPWRKSGSTSLHTCAAFISWTNNHATNSTVIFADAPSLRFTSVIDYHAGSDNVETGAAFGRFRAVYSCPTSIEWSAWTKADGKMMSQQEFAEFLEDRVLDIAQVALEDLPLRVRDAIQQLQSKVAGPAEVMALSRGLAVNIKEKAEVKYDPSSGQRTVRFDETHRDSNGVAIKIPDLFVIKVPIFLEGAVYTIPVRLRYRVREGAVSWFFNIWRPEIHVKDAFDQTASMIGEAVSPSTSVLAGGAPEIAPIR